MDKNFARIGIKKEVLEEIDVELSRVLDPDHSSKFRQHISNHISSAFKEAQEDGRIGKD